VVPPSIISDPARFVRQGVRGFAEWKHSTHVVEQSNQKVSHAHVQGREVTDKKETVWVISDRNDALYGHVVPNDVVSDHQHFVRLGNRGYVEWKHATHIAHLSKGRVHCSDHGLCKVATEDLEDLVMRRFETLPLRSLSKSRSLSIASILVAVLMVAAVAGFVLFRARLSRRQVNQHLKQQRAQRSIGLTGSALLRSPRSPSPNDSDALLSIESAL